MTLIHKDKTIQGKTKQKRQIDVKCTRQRDTQKANNRGQPRDTQKHDKFT